MTLAMDGHGPAVLQVTPQPGRDGICLQLAGELDLATAGHLVDIARALPAHQLREVQLDVTELAFVDAAGLTALLKTRTVVHDGGGRLVLLGVSPFLRRLLVLTGLDATFDIRTAVRPVSGLPGQPSAAG